MPEPAVGAKHRVADDEEEAPAEPRRQRERYGRVVEPLGGGPNTLSWALEEANAHHAAPEGSCCVGGGVGEIDRCGNQPRSANRRISRGGQVPRRHEGRSDLLRARRIAARKGHHPEPRAASHHSSEASSSIAVPCEPVPREAVRDLHRDLRVPASHG